MASSQNDIPNDQPVPRNIWNKTDTYEDKIDLIDYFSVLWKRKYFIVLGSALPALFVGLIVFLSPRDYKVTCTYDTGLDEKGCNVLLDQFSSAENVDKLVGGLKENEFDTPGNYPRQILTWKTYSEAEFRPREDLFLMNRRTDRC